MSHRQPDWHLIGWDGITVRVPRDWDMGAITSEEKGGYLRLDGPDGPRLEVKWHSPSGFVDLNKTVEDYLKQITRSRRRRKQSIEIERDIKVVSKRKVGKDILQTFTWQAEQRAYGAVWLCKQCGRVVITQVLGPVDDRGLRKLAEKVIATVTDHPTDGWKTWAAYDFMVAVPEDFTLKSQKMMAGLMEFSFVHDTEKVTAARWGMANVALGGESLEEWARQQLGKTLRQYGPKSEPTEHRGHCTLALRGERLLLFQGIQRFLRRMFDRRYADQLRGYVWHCEAENKIYVVYAYLDRANYDLAEQMRDRIVCCQAISM